MFKKFLTILAICSISLAMLAGQNRVITNQTFGGKVKSALFSGYEYMQQKAASAGSWISHRYSALRGRKPQQLNDHPEELLQAPERNNNVAQQPRKK